MPFLPEQTILDLSLDELGLAVLEALQPEWNVHNWMLGQDLRRGPAQEALAEAVQWLYARGMIARNWDKTSGDAFVTTRLGRRALQNGIREIRAVDRLAVDLQPVLEREVRPLYLTNRWDLAAFAAMKQVEVRARSLARESDELIGVKLMRKVFGDGGVLRSEDMDKGEQVARMELFAGAIGAFKNPSSHREVDFDDPTEASEVILLADLLLRILDRIAD